MKAIPDSKQGMKNIAAALLRAVFWIGWLHSKVQGLDDIVFIVDGSGSIDAADWTLQKNGFVAALQNQALVPRDGSIAVAVVQFSTPFPRTEVPLTVINTQNDVDVVVAAINAMIQINSSNNPGDGISLATDLLSSSARPTASQTFCMSTDGLFNSGQLPATALNAAQLADFGLDRFGVIAIEDPNTYTYEDDFQREYDSLVFGGG